MDINVKKCTVPPQEVARVKGLGFLRDKTTEDCFNGRVITGNGKITADEMEIIALAAKKFGNGSVAMTVRLTVEIQCVPYGNIEPLIAFLGERGLKTGGTGAKVRPIVSCKGTTCQYGLIDTFAFSQELHERFFVGYNSVKLPHKFKIAVGGCPNNCAKPDLNDVGIIGQKLPTVDLEKCRSCKVCNVEKNCPINHATVDDGKINIDLEQCNHCGRCDEKCPFGAVGDYTYGYKIYIGGRWGKNVAIGRALGEIFIDKEDAVSAVEKAILLFKEQGITGERFSDTINRIGFETAEKIILSHEILLRKDEILAQ